MISIDEITSDLNEAQAEAVTAIEGPVLIIAGAGTGKTRVITRRFAYLAATETCRPEEILALAYNKLAASEMSDRISDMIGEYRDNPWASTFHSFCLRVLQDDGLPIGIQRDLRLVDEMLQYIILRRIIGSMDIKHIIKPAEPSAFVDDIQRFINRAKDEIVMPTEFEAYLKKKAGEIDALGESAEGYAEKKAKYEQEIEIGQVYRAYQEYIYRKNACDFGDLIVYVIRLFEKRPEILEKYRKLYPYIIVDEFQDMNYSQIRLLEMLAGESGNICVVGDDDQAIYRFRGASYASFIIFKERFPQMKQIVLHKNYRSTPEILECAHRLISFNGQDRYDPEKVLTPTIEPGECVTAWTSPDEETEAAAIAGTIKERFNQLPADERNYNRFAVLYRAHAHRQAVEEELIRNNIPVQTASKNLLDIGCIRDIISLIRVIIDINDKLNLFRVMTSDFIGLTDVEAQKIINYSKIQDISALDALKKASEIDGLDSAAVEKSTLTARVLERLIKLAGQKDIYAVLQELQRSTGFMSVLVLDGSNEANEKLSQIAGFYKFAQKFAEQNLGSLENGKTSIYDFIEYLDLALDKNASILPDNRKSEDGVCLTTVHGSKGLEYPYVFVIRLATSSFPSSSKSSQVVFPPELENESGPTGDFHKLEERRLAYVALTRARQKLWLSAIDRKYKRPSPFFNEATGFDKDKVIAGIELVINDKHEKSEYDKNIETITTLDPARKAYEIINELRMLPADDGMISRARTLIAELRAEAYRITALDTPKEKRREFLEAVGLDEDMSVDIERIAEPSGNIVYDLLEILGTDEKPFSFSAIDTYKSCPLKFKFNYILRLPVPPQAALTFGSHMHALIEEFFKEIKVNNRRMEPDEVMALYKQKWDTSGYIDKSQERRYLSQGEGILDGFLKNSAFLACVPEAQEMKFNLDINGSKLIGFIDQINIYDDDSIEIIDFKTGKPKDQKSADDSLQLSIYAMACREIYGRLPDKVTFYNLTNNERVSSTRTEEQLEETYSGLCADIDNILSEKSKGAECFKENPGFHCRWCSYNWVCPYQEE